MVGPRTLSRRNRLNRLGIYSGRGPVCLPVRPSTVGGLASRPSGVFPFFACQAEGSAAAIFEPSDWRLPLTVRAFGDGPTSNSAQRPTTMRANARGACGASVFMRGARVRVVVRFRSTRQRWLIRLPCCRPRFRPADDRCEQGDHGDGGESEEGRVVAKCRDDEAGCAQAYRTPDSLNRAEHARARL
jgi:hypothetical protein